MEFTIGEREIGHVHGSRVLDVDFPRRVKDALIAEGNTNDHRFAGGWTSFSLDSEAVSNGRFDCCGAPRSTPR
ncbi:luciferase domain-containing protein [Halalkalicoccus ordinarius]